MNDEYDRTTARAAASGNKRTDMPGAVDRFPLQLSAGQKLVIAVQARKLIPYLADAVPGWFQAVAALYDPNGKEIAYDDECGFDPDPAFDVQGPQ